jgi:hypothetical protein
MREIYLAGKLNKPFLAIQLDSTEIPDEAEYFLTAYPRLHASEMTEIDLIPHIQRFLRL